MRSNYIRSAGEMRSFYRTIQIEDLWHEEAKRSTLLSKSGKLTTSRRVIKSAASSARKRSAAHGRQSTNRTAAVGKRAEEVAGKSEANQARAKEAEKAVANKAGGILGRCSSRY